MIATFPFAPPLAGGATAGAAVALLAALKGRFILSLNDVPAVRHTFGAFALEEVETTYLLPGVAAAKRASELLITAP